MEEWPGYQQVLTLSNPPIETIAGPGDTPDLARLANDELRRICAARPDKFPAWVASLPLNNVEASLAEIDRAVALGARGIQIFTNVDGRPLDEPDFFPVFEQATRHHNLAIWMHPARDARFADYPGEPKSKFEIWQVLGWPYETSVAMARIVFSGLFDRLPELRIVTHHLGAMIPYFAGRVGPLWDQLGSRTSDEDYAPILAAMRARAGGRSIISGCSTTTPRSAAQARRSAAVSIFLAPSASCSPPTARSTPRAARCLSATRSPPSTVSVSPRRTRQKSILETRSAC